MSKSAFHGVMPSYWTPLEEAQSKLERAALKLWTAEQRLMCAELLARGWAPDQDVSGIWQHTCGAVIERMSNGRWYWWPYKPGISRYDIPWEKAKDLQEAMELAWLSYTNLGRYPEPPSVPRVMYFDLIED
jgi:hypothetical protein